MLTIALPKGRLADQTLDLMEKAGYDVSAARDKSRKLILEDKDAGLRFILSKPSDVPTYVLVPAYILHELTVAFKIGVILYIPFIIIDMVVASILMAMGMMMLPPVQISMPFKLILFVLVDGWGLLTQQLFNSVIR